MSPALQAVGWGLRNRCETGLPDHYERPPRGPAAATGGRHARGGDRRARGPGRPAERMLRAERGFGRAGRARSTAGCPRDRRRPARSRRGGGASGRSRPCCHYEQHWTLCAPRCSATMLDRPVGQLTDGKRVMRATTPPRAPWASMRRAPSGPDRRCTDERLNPSPSNCRQAAYACFSSLKTATTRCIGVEIESILIFPRLPHAVTSSVESTCPVADVPAVTAGSRWRWTSSDRVVLGTPCAGTGRLPVRAPGAAAPRPGDAAPRRRPGRIQPVSRCRRLRR